MGNTDCDWSFTYEYMITDNCGNNSTLCSVTYSGADAEAGTLNYNDESNICFGDPNLQIVEIGLGMNSQSGSPPTIDGCFTHVILVFNGQTGEIEVVDISTGVGIRSIDLSMLPAGSYFFAGLSILTSEIVFLPPGSGDILDLVGESLFDLNAALTGLCYDYEQEDDDLTINELPDATIGSDVSVCQCVDTEVDITFTKIAGKAPWTITYELNGVEHQIVIPIGMSTATVQQSIATVGTYVYELTHITDGRGCEQDITGTATVTVTETIVEFESCPTTSIDLGCNPDAITEEQAILSAGTVINNCDLDLTMSAEGGPITGDCIKSQTWTVSAGNDCVPVPTCEVTYTWTDDTEAPVISQTPGEDPDGTDLGCNPTVVAPTFSATDNCGVGAVTDVTTDGPEGTPCAMTQTWTANVNDDCGNPAAPVSVTYTWVEDTEAPVISQTPGEDPDGTDLGCNPTVVAPTFSATDNCGVGAVTDVTTDGPEGTPCAMTQTWTANVNDDCGNPAAPVSVTYTWVEDTEAPVISQTPGEDPDGTDLGCNPTVVAPTFSATDNCGVGAVTDVTTDGPEGTPCAMTQTWTANVNDDCGNPAAPISVTYTWVEDTEAPVISQTPGEDPDGTDLGCNPTVVAPTFSATDNCGVGSVTDVTTDGPEGTPCAMTQTWTANVNDDCGNPAAPVSVTYTWVEDTEAPVISQTAGEDPDGTDLGCNPTIVAPTFSATDNCGVGAVTDVTTDGPEGTPCAMTQTWTANVNDNCGNPAAPVSVTYTWVEDTEAPVISQTAGEDPDGTDLGCNPTVVAPTFSATDNCGVGSVTDVTTDGPEGTPCAMTQTWTANVNDNCGNPAAPVSVTYTWVEDTEAPVISQTAGEDPDGTDLGCNPTIVAPTFSATDNCGVGAVTDVTTDGPEGTPCAMTQTWTANVNDDCGNPAAPVSVTYTWVEDTEAPVISQTPGEDPDGTDLGCNPTVVAPTFSATDNCGVGAVTDVTTDGPEGTPCAMTQTWTANVNDDCGNPAAPVSVTYTWVEDTETPVISQTAGEDPDGTDLGCNPTIVAPTFSATDNCGVGAVTDVTTDGPEGTPCAMTQTWTANVNDNCGNPAAPVSVTYTWVEDTEAPVISQTPGEDPDGTDLGCNPTVVAPTFSATDNCGVGAVTDVTTDGPEGTPCAMTQTWTANVNDNCGNPAAPVSVTYTWVEDTEAPVISLASGADPTGTDYGCVLEAPSAPIFEVDEVCSPLDELDELILIDVQTTGIEPGDNCNYSQTWTANYTDGCGNPATAVNVTYTWSISDILVDAGPDQLFTCYNQSIQLSW